jgi:hypothetical protein
MILMGAKSIKFDMTSHQGVRETKAAIEVDFWDKAANGKLAPGELDKSVSDALVKIF